MPWRGSLRGRFHLPVNTDRLESLVVAATGKRVSDAEHRRLFWLRVRCFLRWIGSVAGFVAAMLFLIALFALVILGVFRVQAQVEPVATISKVTTDVILVGFFLWLYLWAITAFFDASSGFARAACDTIRHIPRRDEDWDPNADVAFTNASGNAARALFRAITGRRVNVSLRPDVTDNVTALAERVTLVAAGTGSSFWTERTAEAHQYANLLHDINALVAIKRLDLVAQIILERSAPLVQAGVIVEPGSADIARFLHPLGRRTVLDVLAQYVVPAAAFIVSIFAVIIAALKA